MCAVIPLRTAVHDEITKGAYAAFMDTFELRADETLAGTIETFDRR